jgi:Mg-chelatase subunit ChlD
VAPTSSHAVTTAPALASTDWIMLLVDRSGSMAGIVDATLRGMQRFVRQQKEKRVNLSVVAFGTDWHDQLQLQTLLDTTIADPNNRSILPSMYRPEGDTPLLAAVWTSINRLEQRARKQDRVLLAIMTDGIENASGKQFTKAKVRSRIEQKIVDGWLFVYLGAEFEAWRTGEDMGLGRLNALSWSPTQEGVEGVFQTLADSTERWTRNRVLTSGKPAGRFFPLQLPPPRES